MDESKKKFFKSFRKSIQMHVLIIDDVFNWSKFFFFESFQFHRLNRVQSKLKIILISKGHISNSFVLLIEIFHWLLAMLSSKKKYLHNTWLNSILFIINYEKCSLPLFQALIAGIKNLIF